jgi:histone acetyltransferase (RNA polymerase elongator complex component)
LTDELLARKVIGSVRLSTRPDYIDDERLELLRNHGVKLVELGVQSLDDKVLAAAERGHTAEQVTNAVALLKKYDFKVGLQLMVGMPEQDFSSVKETVEKVLALKPDIARIYPLLVIKGTPLAKSYDAGEFEPLSLEEAVEQAAYMYKKLSEAGIRIIRVGLQPDDELCAEGNILAGPFHPSMGELVQSYLLREKLTPQILEIAKQNGVNVVIITCYDISPLAKYADHILLSTRREAAYEGGSVSTIVSISYIINVLYSAIYEKLRDAGYEHTMRAAQSVANKSL